MSESKFTPGPWHIEQDDTGRRTVRATTRRKVVTLDMNTLDEDAAVIVTAPDGCALAAGLVKYFGDMAPEELPLMIAEDPSTLMQFVDAARALLAKAEGKR